MILLEYIMPTNENVLGLLSVCLTVNSIAEIIDK